MTIYITPRTPDDALSVDSGFESLRSVLDTMGSAVEFSTRRMVMYDDVVFSDFAFHINETNLKDVKCQK